MASRNTDPFATADVLSGRSEAWQLAYQLIPQRPVLGFGLGTSKFLMETYGWMIWEHEGDHFHNSYLTALVETGLVGLIALVAILLVALSAGVRRAQYQRSQPDWASASLPFVLLCGALAHAIFETWLLSAGNFNSLILWVCLPLLYARYRTSSQFRPVVR